MYLTVGIGALLLGINVWFLICLFFCRSKIACCVESNSGSSRMGPKESSVDTELIGLSNESMHTIRYNMLWIMQVVTACAQAKFCICKIICFVGHAWSYFEKRKTILQNYRKIYIFTSKHRNRHTRWRLYESPNIRCMIITEKVAFNISSEASYIYLLSRPKLIKVTKNGPFGEFLKTWSLRSNSVTR